MTGNKKKGVQPITAILLTVFLDMLGVGIIIPVMPALFFQPDSSILPVMASEAYRSIMFGLLVGCYPLMQFFGAPILGALSDRFGRKKMLILSIIGVLIGYLLFAWAIIIKNLWLLFFSRLLPGFAGGNVSIAMSAISDISEEKEKTKNFGLAGMAFGIGFILGPALGGFLGDDSIVSWFRSDTPFWFAAILALVNLIVVHFFFSETLITKRESKFSLFMALRNIVYSFSLPDLRGTFTVVLLLSIGFSLFTQFYAVFLIQKFAFTELDIGLLYCWIGLWFAFTQGGIVRVLADRFRPQKLLSICVLLLGFSLLAVLLPSKASWLYLISPFIAIFQGIIMPNIASLVSSKADEGRQGEMLGINQSMQSLGEVIPPFIAGTLFAINYNLPFITASLLIFIGWAIFLRINK
ncbi:tetracycline resistance MFS efflux pump [Algoriphagus machipongonensis]|uniref:Tetracycline-efflux transporter n=1 Tax=Algoriphagus machipongonensis TaxID=388413 RepID=A3I0S1_9BACT|nr:tetracycline resistance MFS efflux pump [Algoriphagus machipongonensis]EAZ80067.1 tetracycline-efflux transporter [Algoriphagus machipongonensis]